MAKAAAASADKAPVRKSARTSSVSIATPPKAAPSKAKAASPKASPKVSLKAADKALDAKAAPKKVLPSPKDAKKLGDKTAAAVVGTKRAAPAAAAGEPAPGKKQKGILKQAGGKAAKKSPLVSEAPVESDAEEEEADDAEVLKGLEVSGSESEADSSEEDADEDGDSDEEDEAAIKKGLESIEKLKMPSSKDDVEVKARLDAVAKKRKAGQGEVQPSVLYVGRLPKSFIEPALRSYLMQFGDVLRLRISRNRRTGAPKHYAFVEFADADVARIVRETMDNYLVDGRLLQVREVPKEKVHPAMWVGAGQKWRKVPADRRARVQHDKPKTAEQRSLVEKKLLERQAKRKEAIKKAGIEYDFEGYTA